MNSQIIIYQSENGLIKLDVRLENETVWLTQKLMAELFQTTKQNISLHLQNIFEDGELVENSVVKEFLTTAPGCPGDVEIGKRQLHIGIIRIEKSICAAGASSQSARAALKGFAAVRSLVRATLVLLQVMCGISGRTNTLSPPNTRAPLHRASNLAIFPINAKHCALPVPASF